MPYQKNRLIIIVILFLFFFLPKISQGATYYVSKEGLDSNPGTLNQPWLTIQKAANTIQAGDTVIVQSSNYDERVILPSEKSGTSEAKITFKANPNKSVYMKGFQGDKNNYIRIEGFNISYDKGGWLGHGIWIDGNNWEIVDNYLYDIPGVAITATWRSNRTKNNAYIANNKIYKCNKGFVVNGYNWLVENNEVERLYRFDVMEGSPYGEDADYSRFFGENHIIRNNFFHGTKKEEVGRSHTDCFQTFPNYGNFAKNIIIENNICLGYFAQGIMAERELREDGPSHNNIIVRNNIFSGAIAWGIDGASISNLKIYNNVFADIGIHGVGFTLNKNGITPIGTGTTGQIKNNIFYNSGSNYFKDASSSYEASNNLLYKTSGTIKTSSYPNDIVNQDPEFIDPINKDYRLKPTSPAIDAGIDLSGIVDKDIASISRPQGSAWDIGAYEYEGSALPGDTTPPVLSNGLPSGFLQSNVTETTLSLNTNEPATCKYSTTSGLSYSSMPNSFSTTGGTSHSSIIKNLTPGTTYNYYIKCQDKKGNTNSNDYTISFSVAVPTMPSLIKGDLNNDNKVNSLDYSLLISKWFQTTNIDKEDLNQDGRVDVRDLGIMMSNWKE